MERMSRYLNCKCTRLRIWISRLCRNSYLHWNQTIGIGDDKLLSLVSLTSVGRTCSCWDRTVPPPLVPRVAFAILAEAILASKRASEDLAGGSIVLLAVNLFSHKVLSSCRTFSSTDSSKKESLTLVITSLITEWYRFAADAIFIASLRLSKSRVVIKGFFQVLSSVRNPFRPKLNLEVKSKFWPLDSRGYLRNVR